MGRKCESAVLKRELACQELIPEDPCSPHVYRRREVLLVLGEFGTHKAGRAADLP